MKKLLAILSVLLLAQLVHAENAVPSRTMSQMGFMMSAGADAGFSAANWGLSYRSYTFFDGTKPDGFYYSIINSSIIHSIDTIPLADLRILGIGWRGNPFAAMGSTSPFPLSIDLGLAPTWEIRLKPHELALGSAAAAIGVTLGVYIPFGTAGDLGISWEPTVDPNLWHWSGYANPNGTYSDFAIYWVMKSAVRTQPEAWNSK